VRIISRCLGRICKRKEQPVLTKLEVDEIHDPTETRPYPVGICRSFEITFAVVCKVTLALFTSQDLTFTLDLVLVRHNQAPRHLLSDAHFPDRGLKGNDSILQN
jgi:hypothetical protein